MSADPQTESVHGVMVCIKGHGVLITGSAGIGKSSLALELIRQGHQLVADDVVELAAENGRLSASSPAMLKGLLHSRELGTINIEQQFGQQAVISTAPLHFVVELCAAASEKITLEARQANAQIMQIPLSKLSLCVNNPAPIASRLLIWLEMQRSENNGNQTLKQRQQQEMCQ